MVLRLSFAGLLTSFEWQLGHSLCGLNLCEPQFTMCKIGMITFTCLDVVRIIICKAPGIALIPGERSVNISCYS